MLHQPQKGFCGIFVGIPEHQKWYLVYVPSTSKIRSSYYFLFNEKNSSALAYTSQTYSEAIMMRKQDMDAMNSGDESDHDLISNEIL